LDFDLVFDFAPGFDFAFDFYFEPDFYSDLVQLWPLFVLGSWLRDRYAADFARMHF